MNEIWIKEMIVKFRTYLIAALSCLGFFGAMLVKVVFGNNDSLLKYVQIAGSPIVSTDIIFFILIVISGFVYFVNRRMCQYINLLKTTDFSVKQNLP